MWDHYKRHLLASEIGICLICAVLYYKGVPFLTTVFYFLIMQVLNFAGAAWAVRLKRKFDTAKQRNQMREL